MNNKIVQKFYDNFQPPKGFKVDDDFPIARGGTIYLKAMDRSESATKSGLIIPETVRNVAPIGRIMGIGPKVTDLKPGMRVIYNFYANSTIFHNGVEYFMLSEIDIFGVLPDEKDILMITQMKVDERKQYSYDELPDIEDSKEVKQEMQEDAIKTAEFLKKEVTTKHHAVNGQKKN